MIKQEIRKLTWKYFLERKKKEIYDFFDESYPLFLMLMIISGVIFQIGWATNEETGIPFCKTLAIIGLFMIGFWLFIGLIALIKRICEWIKSNWKKAKEKARRELK